MAFLTQVVSFILVMVLTIQQSNAQSIPDRCRCITTSPKAYRLNNIEEFSITAPRSRCKDTEIILTLKTVNPKTKEKVLRCISPNIYLAEQLQECWNGINKDAKRTTVKILECNIFRNAQNTKGIGNTTTVAQP